MVNKCEALRLLLATGTVLSAHFLSSLRAALPSFEAFIDTPLAIMPGGVALMTSSQATWQMGGAWCWMEPKAPGMSWQGWRRHLQVCWEALRAGAAGGVTAMLSSAIVVAHCLREGSAAVEVVSGVALDAPEAAPCIPRILYEARTRLGGQEAPQQHCTCSCVSRMEGLPQILHACVVLLACCPCSCQVWSLRTSNLSPRSTAWRTTGAGLLVPRHLGPTATMMASARSCRWVVAWVTSTLPVASLLYHFLCYFAYLLIHDVVNHVLTH